MAEQFLTLMADLDDESQKIMSGLYERLQKEGFVGVQTPNLPYHISLGCYALDKENEVIELAKKMAKDISKFPVYVSHLGVFPGGKVLFGAPDMSSELIAIREVSTQVECDQKFIWTPHATIIIDEPEVVGKALSIVASSFIPFFGRIERLHLCAFWPTREILSIELKEE